jgi:hypothetical protein
LTHGGAVGFLVVVVVVVVVVVGSSSAVNVPVIYPVVVSNDRPVGSAGEIE